MVLDRFQYALRGNETPNEVKQIEQKSGRYDVMMEKTSNVMVSKRLLKTRKERLKSESRGRVKKHKDSLSKMRTIEGFSQTKTIGGPSVKI